MIDLVHYRGELQAELHNILQYWMAESIDPISGQFYGEIDSYGNKKTESPKGIVLYARLMWTFAAVKNFFKDSVYLPYAETCKKFIEDYFFDKQNGGYYWKVAFNGEVINPKKQVYAQAFVMYAYAELYHATGDDKNLSKAMDIFYSLQIRCADMKNGGYYEAFTPDWQLHSDFRITSCSPNVAKSTSTHILLIEAFSRLLQVSKNPHVRNGLQHVLDDTLTHCLDANGHLKMFHTENWENVSEYYSFGHDIEASWMFWNAAEIINDEGLKLNLRNTIMHMVEVFMDEAINADFSIKYEYDFESKEYDLDRHWWVQVEAMSGLLNACNMFQKDECFEKVIRIWNYIHSHLIDRKKGEWYLRVNEQGKPYIHDYKVGMWKTPYHSARAIMNTIQTIQRILHNEQK